MKTIIAIGLTIGLSVPVSAGARDTLTLENVREGAVQRSLDVALARWDLAGAEAEAAAWTGAALPSIAAFVSGSTGQGFTAFGFERPVAAQFGAGVTARVMLVDPSTWAAAAAARRTAEGREATLAWAQVMARQDATMRFATLVTEQQVVKAMESAGDDARREVDAVQALVDAGLRPRADVERIRAQQLDFRARAEEAKGRVVAACAALQDLIAGTVSGVCSVPEPPTPAEPVTGPEVHPALVAARAALAGSEASRTSTVASHLPTVSADAGAAHYTVPDRAAGFGWSAGFRVDIPVSVAGEGVGRIRAAEVAVDRAEEGLLGQQRALDATRIAAEAAWEAAAATVEARRGGLQAAEEALRLVTERYRAGLTSVTELLDARGARADAAVGLLRAEAARWSALAALEAARGVR